MGHINAWQIEGEKVEPVTDFLFLSSKITADGDWSHEIKRCLLLRKTVMANLYSILKSRDITLLTKVHIVKVMVFPVVMYVQMWGMDHKKGWVLKNLCFWTVVLEKMIQSPLDCKEIKPVSPKGNQSWIFFGRTDAEVETPILWPTDAKSWLIRKDNDAGKDWRQEEKGTTEDEMVVWHHWLNGFEYEQAPEDGERQGGLACCSLWGHRVRYDWVTEQQQCILRERNQLKRLY